jgi:hypothetical protein
MNRREFLVTRSFPGILGVLGAKEMDFTVGASGTIVTALIKSDEQMEDSQIQH